MKQTVSFFLAAVLCLSLTACGNPVHIAFPFEVSEVERVELYNYIIPSDAKKKVITEQTDIESLYTTLEGISLKVQNTEPHAGSAVTSFRFQLSDGTVYEVISCCWAVKSSCIQTTGSNQILFTSADIGGLWLNADVEATKADESELPVFR